MIIKLSTKIRKRCKRVVVATLKLIKAICLKSNKSTIIMLWEQGVGSSNLSTPTSNSKGFRMINFETLFYFHKQFHKHFDTGTC